MSEKFLDPTSAPDLVPIREIARITGVNTVTLRAWERRYGLLIPQRTPKGHRLYKITDIERVQEIQVWLARGVAISKVKNLLTDSPVDAQEDSDSIWLQLSNQIHMYLNAFNRSGLEHVFAEIFSLYPVEIIADHLIDPLFGTLRRSEFGFISKRAFLESVLTEYLHAAIYRQRQSGIVSQNNVFFVSSPEKSDVASLLLVYSLLVRQFNVEYLGALDMKEILLCVNALDAKIIILVGSAESNINQLNTQLKIWAEKKSIPLILVGRPAVTFSSLRQSEKSDFHLCETIQHVHQNLNQLIG